MRIEPVVVLIPKTAGVIWLNRLRIWLPPAFALAALLLCRPAWHLWGLPFVFLGQALRTWAAGHLLKDKQLTVTGPYAYLRHPLYLGSSLSGIGFLVILGDWRLALAFAASAIAVYLPTVRDEEAYLRRMHGEAFDRYRRQVPAIIPRCRPPAAGGASLPTARFSWRQVWLNKEHKTWLALALLFALLLVRTHWP